MNDFYKDILTGAMFVTGLIGFISGEFVISSALFATASIASNVNLNRKRGKAGQLSCEWCTHSNCLPHWLEDFQGLTALEVFWLLDFLPLHKSLKTLGSASSLLLPKSSSTARPESPTNLSLSAFHGLLAWLISTPFASLVAEPLAKQLGTSLLGIHLNFAYSPLSVAFWFRLCADSDYTGTLFAYSKCVRNIG